MNNRRAFWDRARNWAMFLGTAVAGSVLAEVTLRMAEVVPPDSPGTRYSIWLAANTLR